MTVNIERVPITSNDQDTSINFGRNEKALTIYSNDTTFLTKLKKAGYPLPELDFAGGCSIVIPKNALTIRANPDKKAKRKSPMAGRKLSEEHKAKLREGRKAKREN